MNDPAGLAMLPQPFAALAMENDPDIRIALDLNREWENLSGGSLITGVTVARKELLEGDKAGLNRFLSDYQTSTAYVNENIAQAAGLIEEYGILNAKTAEKALPNCAITFIMGQEMKGLLDPFYQVLFRQNPASTGGAVPDDAFYYVP
jgi:NitT/TauT family transport system substrate-binding protein